MTRYMSLLSFAKQGLDDVSRSPDRAQDFRGAVEQAGGKVIEQYWCLGSYDGVVIFEAPDEATATALLLKLDQRGNVRTQTLRVYNQAEFKEVLSK